MQQQQAAHKTQTVKPGKDRPQQQRQTSQPQGKAQILAGQGVAGNAGHRHHDDGNGRDQLGLHRSLAHDQRPDDGDRVPDGVGHAQARLLQQTEGRQHPQHLQSRGKRQVLLRPDDAQQQPGGDHLRMIESHRRVKARQQQPDAQGQPA